MPAPTPVIVGWRWTQLFLCRGAIAAAGGGTKTAVNTRANATTRTARPRFCVRTVIDGSPSVLRCEAVIPIYSTFLPGPRSYLLRPEAFNWDRDAERGRGAAPGAGRREGRR